MGGYVGGAVMVVVGVGCSFILARLLSMNEG
jgi:hypothetical protein